MENESLIKQLKSLSTITPDPVFLKWSRYALLAEATPRRKRFSLRLSFAPFALLAPLSVAALIFFITNTAPSPASPDAITSLNAAEIRLEQDTALANNPGNETKYFKGIAPNVALALNDIGDPRNNWGSTDHLQQGIVLLHETNN